jgi:hypothetical protein
MENSMRKYESFYNLSKASVSNYWKCQSSLTPLMIVGTSWLSQNKHLIKQCSWRSSAKVTILHRFMYVVFRIIFLLTLLGYTSSMYWRYTRPYWQIHRIRIRWKATWDCDTEQGTSIWQCWSCLIFAYCCQLHLQSTLTCGNCPSYQSS